MTCDHVEDRHKKNMMKYNKVLELTKAGELTESIGWDEIEGELTFGEL